MNQKDMKVIENALTNGFSIELKNNECTISHSGKVEFICGGTLSEMIWRAAEQLAHIESIESIEGNS